MFVFFNNISMYHMHDVDTVYDLPSKEHLILILGEKKIIISSSLYFSLHRVLIVISRSYLLQFLHLRKLGYKYVNNKSEYLDSNMFMNQQFNPLVYTLTSVGIFSILFSLDFLWC